MRLPGIVITVAALHAGAAEEFTDPLQSGGTGPLMVSIYPAKFEMGWFPVDTDRMFDKRAPEWAKPRRTVQIEDVFAMSKDEVTVAEFAEFVQQTRYLTLAERSGAGQRPAIGLRPPEKQCLHTPWAGHPGRRRGPVGFDFDTGLTWRNPGYPTTDKHPVACIAREDATAYAKWLAKETGHPYRLPSEAEWEYAARAGRSDWDLAMLVEDNDADTRNDIQSVFPSPGPADERTVNAFGLRGLGTRLEDVWFVAEWTVDCWHPNYEGAPEDGEPRRDGDCRKGVVRGHMFRPFAGRNVVRLGETTTETALGLRVVRSPLSGPLVRAD
ncbi:MAG: SUMF1/EgtB/PvdO family nonheme iron enzyme [Gammaproteobacteria bacterium]|nr:SUMF1/EgtB/PvdO family nonheme iron enzyme [Gammaproteobacteria bacterium]MDE0441901.1 SUMF1/EgtB/PvdO family nonheme iron enzyme [Gammaproteobacteria bacterium]